MYVQIKLLEICSSECASHVPVCKSSSTWRINEQKNCKSPASVSQPQVYTALRFYKNFYFYWIFLKDESKITFFFFFFFFAKRQISLVVGLRVWKKSEFIKAHGKLVQPKTVSKLCEIWTNKGWLLVRLKPESIFVKETSEVWLLLTAPPAWSHVPAHAPSPRNDFLI